MKNYRKLLIAKVPGYKALLEDSQDIDLLWHMSGLPGNTHTCRRMYRAYMMSICGTPVPDSYIPDSWLCNGIGWRLLNRQAYLPILSTSVRGLLRDGVISYKAVAISKFLRGLAGSIDSDQRDFMRPYYDNEHRNGRQRPDPYTATFRQRLAKMSFTPQTFKYDRAISIEIEGFCALKRDCLTAQLPVWAHAADDGSINPPSGNHPHEVKVLFPRGELEPRLFRLCKLLDSMRFGVNSSCGLHVHFDQRGKTFDAVLAKAKIVDKWLYGLRELLPESRRENRYARFGISQSDRYRAVNVCSFGKHQTLEIRVHSGTCDYQKVIAWIRLCEVLLALNKKPKPGTCIGTLEQLPIAEHDMAYWRARHRILNPRQYDNNASISSET
jgi:hypothetical protein